MWITPAACGAVDNLGIVQARTSFGPAVILSLWWQKTTRQGIIAGLFTGSLSTIIWGSSPYLQSFMTERLSSFVLAFLAVLIFSKITFKKKVSILKVIFLQI